MSSVFQIYYDHWGKEELRRRKYNWLFRNGYKDTMQKTFLFCRDTLGIQTMPETHFAMLKILKNSLLTNLEDIISFYTRYDHRLLQVQMDFLKHLAHHLFPDAINEFFHEEYQRDLSSSYFEILRIRKRLQRDHPARSFKNPLFYKNVHHLRSLEAIIA